MSVQIIRDYFDSQRPETAQEEQHLIREILQTLLLSSLSRAGLFKIAAFHGGTCLRILFGLRRFSEDLDFILKAPHSSFQWEVYEKALREELELYDIDLELRARSSPSAIRTLWLKSNSFGQILDLQHPFRPGQKVSVKLEIDCDPPSGSTYETGYVSFPVPFSVLAQDLVSGFANKLHALLCREYIKGRDWYDLSWYSGRQIRPNLPLLQNAIIQQGPWSGQALEVTAEWLIAALNRKVNTVDFAHARRDVERFLGETERRGLEVWSTEFFLHEVQKLEQLLVRN